MVIMEVGKKRCRSGARFFLGNKNLIMAQKYAVYSQIWSFIEDVSVLVFWLILNQILHQDQVYFQSKMEKFVSQFSIGVTKGVPLIDHSLEYTLREYTFRKVAFLTACHSAFLFFSFLLSLVHFRVGNVNAHINNRINGKLSARSYPE